MFTRVTDTNLLIALDVSGVFVPFWILMYVLFNPRVIADGATDNLTGCAMGISFLKTLKDNGVEFENTFAILCNFVEKIDEQTK